MSNSVKPIAALGAFLETHNWEFQTSEDGQAIRGLTTGEHGGWTWSAACARDGEILMFHATLPTRVPKSRRGLVAEFLSRANWGLIFGNFEMDWSDGQVVFRTSVPVVNETVSEGTLGHLVWANCMIMDRYLPGLMTVAFGRTSPKRAIARAEEEPKTPRKAAKNKETPPADTQRRSRFFSSEN